MKKCFFGKFILHNKQNIKNSGKPTEEGNRHNYNYLQPKLRLSDKPAASTSNSQKEEDWDGNNEDNNDCF